MNLFDPIVPPKSFHPNFKSLLHRSFEEGRAVLSFWGEDFADRDGKFVKEFQTTFNSSYWELYLNAVFKELRFSIDWSHSAPDFYIVEETCEFVVEATTANAAEGKPKEWEKDVSAESVENLKFNIPEINREATIRLSNSIVAKHRKYLQSYKKLSHVSGKPFVIAVGPFEQPWFFLQHDRPIKSLLYDYYVDEEAYKQDPEKFPNGPPGISLGTIVKDNGSEIELGFFNSNVMEEVSAIIFSATATIGKVDALANSGEKYLLFNYMRYDESGVPKIFTGKTHEEYDETLLDGLQVYHNPFAKYPLNTEIFRKKGIVQSFYDDRSASWIEEGIPGSLVWRQVSGLISEDESQHKEM